MVLHTDSIAIGPLISFEATFSDLPRREVQLGAQLLVYQSSTSTFQGSWAQPQLASQVAVHAVEVGRAAVHTGLSGVSSAFDAEGRQLAWGPSTYRGVIVVRFRSDRAPPCTNDWATGYWCWRFRSSPARVFAAIVRAVRTRSRGR